MPMTGKWEIYALSRSSCPSMNEFKEISCLCLCDFLSPERDLKELYSRDKLVYLITKLNQSSIEETLGADSH